MAAVGSPGISTASFSLVFIDIDPAVVKALLKHGQILLPQRRQTFLHNGLCLLIGIMAVHFRHHGHVKVIHVKFIHSQTRLSQGRVTVKLWKVFSHGLHQIVIDQLRHFVLRQVILSAGLIFFCLCVKYSLLYIGRKCGRQGVAILCIHAVKPFKGVLSDPPVLVLHQGNIVAVGDLDPFAVFPCDHRKLYIRIVEHGKYLAGSLCGVIGLGQKLLHLTGQGVPAFIKDHLQRTLKVADAVIRLHKIVQCFFRYGKDLRNNKRGIFRSLVREGLGPGKHILIPLLGRVLVRAHPGIYIKKFYFPGHLIIKFQALVQAVRGLCQFSPKIRILLYFQGRLLKQLFPLAVTGHHVLQFPRILNIYLTALLHMNQLLSYPAPAIL